LNGMFCQFKGKIKHDEHHIVKRSNFAGLQSLHVGGRKQIQAKSGQCLLCKI
jgi:hypothetical protein